ncbi:MarR family winged helix-turn-helix transcriptional regulator [Rhizobium sp. G21]|uniref:MarR family winged helix-turn-helix transcriptional regulator n=1 Tax=Rhizobium sp. G21 TaxID=2758439 RepID=UPI0016020675|nr:MarR family transcriptional regulator [Rhizobium sp. G21]MBB1248444.1 MarR family transcriptional regulator [Rhizobium sp. G21]
MPLSLYDQMNLLTRKVRKTFDNHARARGMTLARGRLLRLLGGAPEGLAQNVVAQEIEVEGPTLVRMLDGLETQGYLVRQSDPGDRRVKLVRLTEEGRRQSAEVEALAQDFRARLQSGLDPADVAAFERVVARMAKNVEELA